MKAFFFSALMLFGVFISTAQELKTKKIQGPVYTEIFQINKETKKKQGEYLQILNFSKDTLKKGSFTNDSISGVWTYFDRNNQPRLKFDYSADSCIWLSEIALKPDTFPIRLGNEFGFTRLDRPPVYIGFYNEPAMKFEENIKIPVEFMESGDAILGIASFVVNKKGEVTEINTDEIENSQFRFAVEKTFRTVKWKYLPGILNGQPVDTKLYLVLDVGPGSVNQVIPKKPYATYVKIGYFGVKRTVLIRSSTGVSPYGRNTRR